MPPVARVGRILIVLVMGLSWQRESLGPARHAATRGYAAGYLEALLNADVFRHLIHFSLTDGTNGVFDINELLSRPTITF